MAAIKRYLLSLLIYSCVCSMIIWMFHNRRTRTRKTQFEISKAMDKTSKPIPPKRNENKSEGIYPSTSDNISVRVPQDVFAIPKDPNLIGNLTINTTLFTEQFYALTSKLRYGGYELKSVADVFESKNGVRNLTVAIIIPIRNRAAHLRILLGHLVPVLQRQVKRFQIFTAYQWGNVTFNKGRLMNTAFKYIVGESWIKNKPFDCFIFHDVDLLTESDLNIYECYPGTNKVKHIAHGVNKFNYTFCCGMTVGGVLAFSDTQFIMVNGYSNTFWGWGGEDDDMNSRIEENKLEIVRPDLSIGRFSMIKHKMDTLNPYNENVLRQLGTRKKSNFGGVSDCPARVVKVQSRPLFINLIIEVGD